MILITPKHQSIEAAIITSDYLIELNRGKNVDALEMLPSKGLGLARVDSSGETDRPIAMYLFHHSMFTIVILKQRTLLHVVCHGRYTEYGTA